MKTKLKPTSAPARRRPLFGIGAFVIALSAIGLVVGWLLIQWLTTDLRATISVSQSAVETIGATVDVAADLSEGTSDAMESASRAASSAAVATRDAATGLVEVSSFLRGDLPDNIEAIRRSLPGAIDAADSIDSTLGALSLIGLDYSPDEPFGESLRRIQAALNGLPGELRSQSEALDQLAPAAGAVADDVDRLAADLGELRSTLIEVDSLADSYTATVSQAETAVAETRDSLDRTVLALRIMLVLSALGAAMVGYGLISIDRRLLAMPQPVTAARSTSRVL